MPQNDTQKVILITGTSSGFGLLTSARLASRGHFVYATMRDVTKNALLMEETQKRGGQIYLRALDVTQPETIIKVVDEIKDRHGHIDVLINNAGYGIGGFFEDLSDEEIRKQMEVNFFGVQNVTRAVVPLMRRQKKGKIINISSIAGLCSSPSLGAYNASKWALEGFSESLCHELALFGIKVVLVEPGSYPTRIFGDNACYAQNFNNPQSPYYPFSQRLKKFVKSEMFKSKKDPEDVAQLIERIINTQNPKLRYISDASSALRVLAGRMIPPSIYNYIFRKVIYGKLPNTL